MTASTREAAIRWKALTSSLKRDQLICSVERVAHNARAMRLS